MRLRSEIRSIGLDSRSVWETLVNLNACRLITHDPMTPDRVQAPPAQQVAGPIAPCQKPGRSRYQEGSPMMGPDISALNLGALLKNIPLNWTEQRGIKDQ